MEKIDDIKWLGHASFFFIDNSGHKIYFIDPFQLEGKKLNHADIIFITHAHPDHFSIEAISKIIRDDTIVIATADVLEKITIQKERKVSVTPNQKYKIKGFSFETFPAYNNHPNKLNFHPKANNWVGYIFNLNGKKVYHAGDTDFIEEMKYLKEMNLDIAMLPIGGTYTMHSEEAAAAANAICAKITIPMHYKSLNQGHHKELEEDFINLVTNSKVLIFDELK